MSFVFSADGHIVEPAELFTEGLPQSLKHHAILSEVRGEHRVTVTGDKVLHQLRMRPDSNTNDQEQEATAMRKRAEGEQPARKALGHKNVEGRLVDMKAEGIDAEIVFPSLGLWTFGIENIDAELASCEIYNNWNNKVFKDYPQIFVRCGVLPVRNLANTMAEMRRIAAMGFTAAMLPVASPVGVPRYNSPLWDPVFSLAGELELVIVLHTGTGLPDVVVERGPGGAVINYARQLCDGADAVMWLVAGGVLDRNPKVRVAVIEAGASWLPAVAERMDEVYNAHYTFVRPKLGRMPSQIIRDQVKCSFQYDRACIIARDIVGTGAIMWGSDYPHAEGTFPNTRLTLQRLFEGIDISEREKADILGGNAARLFRLPRAEFTSFG
jgi:predicted TIM-barrel fold metal-dependent hydrolase